MWPMVIADFSTMLCDRTAPGPSSSESRAVSSFNIVDEVEKTFVDVQLLNLFMPKSSAR